LSKYLKQAQNPAEQATLERTRKCGWQWIWRKVPQSENLKKQNVANFERLLSLEDKK
jgi:hypothetical protein